MGFNGKGWELTGSNGRGWEGMRETAETILLGQGLAQGFCLLEKGLRLRRIGIGQPVRPGTL